MKDKPYFPLFFNLSEKKIVVAGAGKIATRRIKSLLGFGANIFVIAPEVSNEVKELSKLRENLLQVHERSYETKDCENAFWMIAATDNREINQKIGVDGKNAGAFVTISDAKEESDVFFPGIAKEEYAVIGVTASGKNHFMAKKITRCCQEKLREWFYRS